MKILYMSSLTSPRLINKLYDESGINPGFQVQKFHGLIVRGFVRNQVEFKTLTGLPITRAISKKIWWNMHSEMDNGINYKYIPFINYSILRQICLFIYSFCYTLYWGASDRKNKTIVCDVLNISLCIGGLLASKIVGIKSVGIMTDMPGLLVSRDMKAKNRVLENLMSKINKGYLTFFSAYVFLTEQMNIAVNSSKRPYIVMEGLVDEKMADAVIPGNNQCPLTRNERILMYAGGLHEKYGLKMLTEAFMKLPYDDIRLHLYGDGPFTEDLYCFCQKDKRIVYKGVVPNEDVVHAELGATLLINPRPTSEEFTMYSFPSKNMEYMVSGTPVLTTQLPGMPEEYYPYVYMFNEETVDGYTATLNEILLKAKEERQIKGHMAKEFVLQKKNNVYQAKRIIELINLMASGY